MLVRAACPHDCPGTCGMLVTVQDGVAVKIQGDPTMPFTDGTLCTKVAHYLERTYAPDRLLHPLKRAGPKGSGRFERISWHAPDGGNASNLTAQRTADLGGGATFYDCMVQVERLDAHPAA